MTNHLPLPLFAATEDPGIRHTGLALIFGFILGLILIRGYFRQRRIQLWHETARIALEKGQPPPERFDRFDQMAGRGFGRWGGWTDFRRGIIFLAVGSGLYFARPEEKVVLRAILLCAGAGYLFLGGIALLRRDKDSDFRDPTKKL